MKHWIIITTIAVVYIALFWGCKTIYNRGYSAAETVYQRKAVQAAMCKIENTETLEVQKAELKQREKNLDEDCKALYRIDLSACRRQLRGQR